MFKRILCLAAVLVLIMSVFSACGKDGAADSVSSSADGGINTADISFVDADGEAVYRIVRPETAVFDEGAEAARVFKQYKDKYSVSPKNIDDSTADDGGFEILIGETDRAETATVKQQLINASGRSGAYAICSVGNKIVIYGMSKDSLTAAVDKFLKDYLTGSTVTGGINVIHNDSGNYNTVSIGGETNLSLYKIVRPRYNTSYLTELEIDNLINVILTSTGYNVGTITDFTVDEFDTDMTDTETADTEIVIGNCTRDGVEKIGDYDAYEIRFVGKKVYLNGGSPYATAMAVAEFAKMLSEGDKTFTDESSITDGSYSEAEADYSSKDYYKLTWGDDFDGAKIDTTKWEVDYTGSTVYGNGIGGKKLNRSTTETTYLNNGKLYICAKQTATDYYGGMLWTPGTMRYLYGYLEISTLHPKGDGFWTALWTNSDVGKTGLYYSETDIEECYGEGTYVKGNTFAWPSALCKEMLGITSHAEHIANTHYATDGRGFWMDFHTFGFEWDETTVRFTCDGETYGEQDITETPGFKEAYSTPAFLRLSMATGFTGNPLGRITDDPDEWANTNKYIVDYVHLYQKDGAELDLDPEKVWINN